MRFTPRDGFQWTDRQRVSNTRRRKAIPPQSAADKRLYAVKGKPLDAKLKVLLNPSGGYHTEFMNWMSKKKFMSDTIRFISDAGFRKKHKKFIYETYVKAGAKLQVNSSGQMLAPYTALAEKGQFQKMDFTKPLNELKGLQDFNKIVEEYLAEKSPPAAPKKK